MMVPNQTRASAILADMLRDVRDRGCKVTPDMHRAMRAQAVAQAIRERRDAGERAKRTWWLALRAPAAAGATR